MVEIPFDVFMYNVDYIIYINALVSADADSW